MHFTYSAISKKCGSCASTTFNDSIFAPKISSILKTSFTSFKDNNDVTKLILANGSEIEFEGIKVNTHKLPEEPSDWFYKAYMRFNIGEKLNGGTESCEKK